MPQTYKSEVTHRKESQDLSEFAASEPFKMHYTTLRYLESSLKPYDLETQRIRDALNQCMELSEVESAKLSDGITLLNTIKAMDNLLYITINRGATLGVIASPPSDTDTHPVPEHQITDL
jgi:hypothetical protein